PKDAASRAKRRKVAARRAGAASLTAGPPRPGGRGGVPISGSSANQAPAEPESHRVCTVRGAELLEQATRVRLDRVLGEEQLTPDLGVGPSVAHTFEHLDLPRGERGGGPHLGRAQ